MRYSASVPAAQRQLGPLAVQREKVILNNFYPGSWWDHPHLTVAVQAHPSATTAQAATTAARWLPWPGQPPMQGTCP